MKKVLITGGAGFIGKELASTLVEAGYSVAIFDNLSRVVHSDPHRTVSELNSIGVKVVLGDVRDGKALREVVCETTPETVVHLAAETGTGQSYDLPVHYCDVNILGTAQLVEALRSAKSDGIKIRRVVLAGSRAVYGEGPGVDDNGCVVTAVPRRASDLATGDFSPKDSQGKAVISIPTAAAITHPAPASVYASTKLMQEYLLRQGLEETGIECFILRLQNVFGAGQSLRNPYTGVLSVFAQQLLDGKVLDIFEDGKIKRDFIYISDVVSAFHRVCEVQDIVPQILDIGSGKATTIAEVAKIMTEKLSLNGIRTSATGQFRIGDVRHAVADISAAKAALNWAPKIDLHEGVEALLVWARAKNSAVSLK
jgi:dTDP-L-rhamnose 4-epimerase